MRAVGLDMEVVRLEGRPRDVQGHNGAGNCVLMIVGANDVLMM